ncbi:hypothetical protein HK099_001778 [Clydaea vesicula]|uniref:Uncharacterized protein n=1 Tax=Clydaea vesicula TaxID=447962 RepID=A0AAD5U683_9FUNG|nr:hypothetical protein HK099_001778 [Clydaea vesicula]
MDAKSCVLLIKEPFLFTKREHDLWVVDKLYKNFSRSSINSTSENFNESIQILELSLENNPFQKNLQKNGIDANAVIRITPQTKIISFAKKYRLVFLIDISASMSIVGGTGKPKVHLTVAFETYIYSLSDRFIIYFDYTFSVCKCIDALTRSFSINSSLHNKTFDIEPELNVTVLADCGNSIFRKYQKSSTSEFCRSFPIKVLIHDLKVSPSLVESFAETLYDTLNAFEVELVKCRQKDFEENDNALVQVNNSSVISNENSPIKSNIQDSIPIKTRGGCIYDSLENAMFALGLFSNHSLPAVVLITDGVSYYPGVNYGHVSDNEFVRFLAMATFGKFLYATDCRYMEPLNHCMIDSPNFFHQQLLFRELNLSKLVADNVWRTVHAGSVERPVDLVRVECLSTIELDDSPEISNEEIYFPWFTTSQPPVVYQVLCGYRDYSMNLNLTHILSARLLEGYSIRSVQISQKLNRPTKVEILLALPWIPNVTVFYTIRTSWINQEKPLLEGLNPKHRIELNILAHRPFVLLFVNQQIETDVFNTALHEKVFGIAESDERLKLVGAFNSRYCLSFFSTDMQISPPYQEQPKSFENTRRSRTPSTSPRQYWTSLGDFVMNKGLSVEDYGFDIILRTYDSLISTTRKEIENQRLTAYKALSKFLGNWSSYNFGKGVYLKLIFTASDDEIPIGFCYLRISSETELAFQIRIFFSNLSSKVREGIVKNLKDNISNLTDAGFHLVAVCEKPLRQLLLRYGVEGKKPKKNSKLRSSSLNIEGGHNYQIPEKYSFFAVLRAYLRNKSWVWFSGVNKLIGNFFRGFENENGINDLAFDLIYNRRLQEGFLPVHESNYSTTLYLEKKFTNATSSVQFVLKKDFVNGDLITELWLEPACSSMKNNYKFQSTLDYEIIEEFEAYSNFMEITDKSITNTLYSFLALNLLAKKSDQDLMTFEKIVKNYENINSNFDMRLILNQCSYYSLFSFQIPFMNNIGLFQSGVEKSDEIFQTPCNSSSLVSSQLNLESESSAAKGEQGENLNFKFEQDFVAESKKEIDFIFETVQRYLKSQNPNEKKLILITRFLQSSLAATCDGFFDCALLQKDKDFENDFLESVKSFLSTKFTSEKVFLESLKCSNCFIKFYNSEAFLLIIAPRFCGFDIPTTPNYLGISFFECILPSIPSVNKPSPLPFCNSINETSESRNFIFYLPNVDLKENDENTVPNCHRLITFTGNITPDSTSDKSLNASLHQFAESFLNDLKIKYTKVKGSIIYFGFLQHEKFTATDFDSIINVAMEEVVEVDFTNYLNAASLVSKVDAGFYGCLNSSKSNSSFNIDSGIMEILQESFENVSNFLSDIREYYLFKPKNLKSNGLGKELEDLLKYSLNPMFIELMYLIDRPNSETIIFGSKKFPISYPKEMSDTFLNVGTESNFLGSKDGTRAICRINIYSFGDKIVGNQNFNSVLEEQQAAIQKVKNEINYFLDKIVLEQLLNLNVTESSLALVSFLITRRATYYYQVFNLDSFMDATFNTSKDLSSTNKPGDSDLDISKILKETPDAILEFTLHFIGGKELNLIKNLSLKKNSIHGFDIEKYGKNYLVTKNEFSTGSIDISDSLETVSGLGISTERSSSSENIDMVVNSTSYFSYWFLINIDSEKSVAKFLLFSKSLDVRDQVDMIKDVAKGVRSCCEKLNALFLLQKLNEKKVASKYLIIPGYESLEENGVADDSFTDEGKRDWKPNDGSEVKLTSYLKHLFPLHWRLKPQVALTEILSYLHPFAIMNRKNSIVYVKSTNTIFYIVFSIYGDIQQETGLEDSTNKSSPIMKLSPAINEELFSDSPTIKKTSFPGISNFKTDSSMLMLEVFGLEDPGNEISVEFVSRIEIKLNSLLLQKLGNFFIRGFSSTVKLTKADVDFIISQHGSPHSKYLPLPKSVYKVYLFQLLLRQKLLDHFSIFTSVDISNALERYYESRNVGEPSNSSSDIVSFGDFSFLYNCVPSPNPSPQEILLGQGISCINIVVLDRAGHVILPKDEDFVDWNEELNTIVTDTQSKLWSSLPDANYSIGIECWIHGNINVDALFFKLEAICQSTLSEYFVEMLADTLIAELPTIREDENVILSKDFAVISEKLVELMRIASAKTLMHNNSFSSTITLPSWVFNEFLNDVIILLNESHSFLHPVAIKKITENEKLTFTIQNKNGRQKLSSLMDSSASYKNQSDCCIILAGLCDENSTCLNVRPKNLLERKGSMGSDSSSSAEKHGRRLSSAEELDNNNSNALSMLTHIGKNSRIFGNVNLKMPLDNISHYPGFYHCGNYNKCFLVLVVTNETFELLSHNCNKSYIDQVNKKLLKILSWNNIRIQYLNAAFPLTSPVPPWFSTSLSSNNFFEKNLEFCWSKQNLLYSTQNDVLQARSIDFLEHFIRQNLYYQKKDLSKSHATQNRKVRGIHHSNSSSSDVGSGNRSHEILDIPFNTLLNAVRRVKLYYFAKYPIFFSESREKIIEKPFFFPPPFEADFSKKEILFKKWFKKIISGYQTEYTTYLAQLGLEVALLEKEWEKSMDLAPIPRFEITDGLFLDTEIIYLKKNFGNHAVLIQFGIDGLHSFINMFSLTDIDISSSKKEKISEEYSLDDFNSECEKISISLQLHSFSYDFHIKKFKEMLEDKEIDSCPIDLINTIILFHEWAMPKLYFSHNRIFNQPFVSETARNLSPSLLVYILKNPSRYGFNSLFQNNKKRAFFLVSKTPDFNFKPKFEAIDILPETRNSFVLIVYPNSGVLSPPTENLLSFFVLLIKPESYHNTQSVHNNLKFSVNSDPLLEYLDNGFYLGDIVKCASKKLELLLEQAVIFHGRDSLWKQLINEKTHKVNATLPESVSFDNTEYNTTEWTKLFLEKIAPNSRPLTDIDDQLGKFFRNINIPWNEVLDFLIQKFRETSRELTENLKSKERRIVLFNSKNNDYLIHFVLTTSENTGIGTVHSGKKDTLNQKLMSHPNLVPSASNLILHGFAVSREGMISEVEYEHLDCIVQAISVWLYCRLEI